MASKTKGNNSDGQKSPSAHLVKIVLLGEQGVGKSSIVVRFIKGEFESTEATIGAAYLTKTINVKGRQIKFDIWDTAGQERYHSLAPMYYRGAHVAIVVYDITKKDTFAQAQDWVKELRHMANPNILVALAGNKADCADKREITVEEARRYAEEQKLMFVETSAQSGLRVNDVFMILADKICDLTLVNSSDPKTRVNLDKSKSEKKSCC